MTCHSYWDYYYKQQKELYIKDRIERGNEVRKKTIESMLCPCRKQPCNSRNEAKEVWNGIPKRTV